MPIQAPKEKPADPAVLGVGVQRLQVVERRGGVGELADALVVLALAAADAAEVEAQAGEADAVEGVVEVVDHLVVHRAPVERVGVQDDGDRRVLVLLRMVAPLQPPVGAGENHLGHSGASLLDSVRHANLTESLSQS